jgi:urocanate hydratase
MIKNIISSGKYITVTGFGSYGGAQGVGNMRYNTTTQNIEIYDGTSWMQMQTGYATVQLTSEAESLLDWARQKRNQELELDRLVETNPAIKDLVNQIKEKEEQIKVVQKLIQEEVKV